MNLRAPAVRALVPVVATAAVLCAWPTGAFAGSAALTTDKGVVQAVSDTAIVLRGLDGSSLTFPLGPRTEIRLNGSPATIASLRPGLVAAVTHNGNRPARIVRAFGTVKIVERGIVEAISNVEIVVRRDDGTLVGIALGPATTWRKFGQPAKRAAARIGRYVRVTYEPGSPAKVVAVIRRP